MAAHPILYNGLGSPQDVWTSRTDAQHPVGTRGFLNDGRVYYYARQSASGAIVASNLLSAEVASVDFDLMVTGTHAAGSKTINITPVGTKTYAKDELAGGFVCIQTATTGEGIAYKIRNHIAIAATTATDIYLVDEVNVLIDSGATSTVVKNVWMDPVVAPTSSQGVPAGVSNVAVAAGDTTARFFWCQTWGPACVTAGSASAVGDALMNDSSTAGETLIATAGNPVVATAYSLGANGEFVMAYLTIAP